MTMTAQAALPSPPDPTAYHDPHHPKYGFHTEEWHDMPRPINGTDWFSTEERYRREANAHAYRQIGTPQNWLRYLTLGLFVYDDCTKFDSLWMKYSADPIICHRMVWYNFLFHVDRKLDIPATLSAWATEVSQPYLQRHAPQYLAINSLEYTWNDYVRGDHDVMDIDSTKWTTVGSRKKHSRSRSPPAAANRLDNPTTSVPPSPTPTAAANIIPNKSLGQSAGVISDDAQQRTKSQKHFSSSRSMTTDASSIGKQSAMQQYLNVPTNDGTHRVTFRWKPGGDFKNYNEHSTTWLTEAHTLMTDLFTDDDCSLFRWESTDLTISKVMSELSPGELREFLSPNIVFLPSTSQIIFGARICFAAKFPGQWKNKERTKETLKIHQTSVNISNSTTKSGKDVIAGYILLKAARTTHRTRFLQSLRILLPPETPFFDILQFHQTPADQKITHLAVQCGENHVSTLSKALSELLSGRNSSLYLPRLALANLTPTQISSYFEMQDQYSKSLKSLALFPTLTNLDKPRKEHFEDGTIVERSTREWSATLFRGRTEASARCEVVNGGYDQKAYLLVPKSHFLEAQEHLRQYRLRVNPISRREARFRDSLPGLPSEIHIDTSTQHNLDFLEHLTSAEVWQRAPSSVRNEAGLTRPSPKTADSYQSQEGATNQQTGNKKSRNMSKLLTLGEKQANPYQASDPDPGHDDQTTSTKSATQSVMTPSLLSQATTRRLNELEALFRNQQQAITENSQLSKETDKTLQQTIATLQENSDKLVLTMERQQDSHVQLAELSTRVARLTDVMDRIASQMDALTKITLSAQTTTTQQEQVTEGTTRRRTIENLSILEAQESVQHLHMETHSIRRDAVRVLHAVNTRVHSEKSTSPIKKKSRQAILDKSNYTLHSELEEMSLGSTDDNEQDDDHHSGMDHSVPAQPHTEHVQVGVSLLDDTSDEFSTTTDVMPDLDTQYNLHSDPEGGERK